MQVTHTKTILVCLAQGLGAALLWFAAGCASTPSPSTISAADSAPVPGLHIKPGDQLAIDFFGSPELNAMQTVRMDGKITLRLVGDLKVLDMTPEELQTSLLGLYNSQLQSSSITVTISSSLTVYVSGAVAQPGKFGFLRPTTALEAIMEAGGFVPGQANLHGVVVIRNENGVRRGFVLDYSDALAGASGQAFYLRTGDIVNVPGTKTPSIQLGRR